MKKIGVIVTSIAGIAGLMGLGWTVWNDGFYSGYPMGFTTQEIQPNGSFCGGDLTLDPGFQNYIINANPTSRIQSQSLVNSYVAQNKINHCRDGYDVSDYGFIISDQKKFPNQNRKSVSWGCKQKDRYNKNTPRAKVFCKVSWGTFR